MYREQENSHLEWPDHTDGNRVNARKQKDLQFSDSKLCFLPGVQKNAALFVEINKEGIRYKK